MRNKQKGTTVITLKSGDKLEVKETAAVVTAKYNEADYRDIEELMSWMGASSNRPFPKPNSNHFKVTEEGTDKEIVLSPQQIMEISVDPGDLTWFTAAGNTKITLNSGEEFTVLENYDTVFADWKAALTNTDKQSVLSVTEKTTEMRLALLATSIERLKEL